MAQGRETSQRWRFTCHTIANGDQCWFKEDKSHREGDLPAFIGTDGTQRWYKEGKMHRDGNLPAIIMADGTQYWYINGYYKEHIECNMYPLNLPLGIQYYHQEKVEECPICYEEIHCDFIWKCTKVMHDGKNISKHPYFFHAECMFKSNFLLEKCPYCRSFISNSQECSKFVSHYRKKE